MRKALQGNVAVADTNVTAWEQDSVPVKPAAATHPLLTMIAMEH